MTVVTKPALGLFVLYKSFPRLTAGLEGCAYYYVQQLLLYHSYVYTYPPIVDVSGLTREIKSTFE